MDRIEPITTDIKSLSTLEKIQSAVAAALCRRTPKEEHELTESNSLRLVPLAIVSLLLALSWAAPGFAQHGGKAEPLRIEFKRGTNSTTVAGSVRNDEEYEYVLAAKKGQRLTIKITSIPVKSSVFEIVGENHDTLGLEYDANFDYSGVLPKDGDYFITVARPTTTKGTSRFKLTITIR